jgi:hypothetical protein
MLLDTRFTDNKYWARQQAMAELDYWERNQWRICVAGELPDSPPDIPELRGLLDYILLSGDHYAIRKRIIELEEYLRKINP